MTQLAIQSAFSVVIAVYILHTRPLETPFANKMEVYNECTIITLSYGLLCFTDAVPDPEAQYTIGWSYIIVYLANITLHILLLTYASGG